MAKFIVDCEHASGPARQCHPAMTVHATYDEAMRYIRSKVALGPGIALEHKHIFSIRADGAMHGDWMYRTAG